MTDNQNREKLWQLIKEVRYAMISHITETHELHSQPMTMLNSEKTEQMSEGHNLYFILRDSNDLVNAVNSGRNQIGLSFAKPSDGIYVSISAHAHISTDPALIDQLWNPWAENWFQGKNDPSVRVLIAESISAEYWNVTDNKVTQLFKLLKGSVTGHAGKVDADHNKLDL